MVRGSLPRGFRPRPDKPMREMTLLEQFIWLIRRTIELMIVLLIDACGNHMNTIGRGDMFYNIFYSWLERLYDYSDKVDDVILRLYNYFTHG